jgi:3-oxoacyl-[acyl-carrier protein] reductase
MRLSPWTLTGRRVLVCGGSQGIGRATALAMAELGADVTVLARNAEALDRVVAELEAAGAPAARRVVADHDDRPALDRAIAAHLDAHGPVQVLVHNTGGPPGGPLLAAPDDELARAFGRNVLCGQLLVRRLLPGMVDGGYGRIITVLSTSAREPIANLGVGNTVRAAMLGWSKTLSNELPPIIAINNVLPGYTATERLSELAKGTASRTGRSVGEVEQAWREQIPMGRIAEPEEIARVIAFLALPAASYLRGQTIAVDGGRMRSV